MFGWLTGRWRWRTASLLVALYAFCLAAPTVVLAFSDASVPAHCLTDENHLLGSSHVHDDGTSHQHSGGSGGADHDQPVKCCGLFGVTGIAPSIGFVAGRLPPASHLAPLFAQSLSGRGADRIDRPPRSLLSL
jgi:hypothetical protein